MQIYKVLFVLSGTAPTFAPTKILHSFFPKYCIDMNKMLIVLLTLSFLACRNSSSEKLREQAAQNIAQAQSVLNANSVSSKQLTLAIGEKSVEKGESICLSLTAKGFTGLISMQYSIRWDPKVLRFQNVANFQLPWLSEDNFGMHITDEGVVTFVWIDNDLKGVNVDDGGELYQLCFEVVGDAGQESTVTLAQDPTPFEVVTVEENIIPLKPVAGKVAVR